ncbi:tumor necrosis factor receptor superfamily member 26-like isoform X2 [Rattus rattus]|uniref:tumor necrosis factor receptor superfamily member 26-like isoform X2 n=1 Tax=Rattus rattus TaxID=10117 RepID=UPI0013F39A7C|nr:tumor necrosis factor receptor superfamily member 26-like isoform X2 [Rattus rattus]
MMGKLKTLLLPGLLLWVVWVSSTTQCGSNEFKYENFCCQLCPAGTHLINPCQRNHGESECSPCQAQHFTEVNNSNSRCSRCSECRDDQEEVSECSSTADRKCWCKQGTYCDSENCVEMCHDCSSCPEGRVIKECNATMDTVCDSKQGLSGHSPELWVILVSIAATAAVIATVIVIIYYCCYKKGEMIQLWKYLHYAIESWKVSRWHSRSSPD